MNKIWFNWLKILKIRNLNEFYSIQREFKSWIIQETINDGVWVLIWNNKDNLLYNKKCIEWLYKKEIEEERLETIIKTIKTSLADILLWVDFTQPWRNIEILKWNIFKNDNIKNQIKNRWYLDTLLLENPFEIFNNSKSIAIWSAVWDCAAISSFYIDELWKKQIIWLTHVWYVGLKNWVVEQLIDAYKSIIWRKNLKHIYFDISPLAWENYEFEKEFLLKLFADIFKEYDIDYIQDGIFKPYINTKEKGDFMIWKLLERILLENGIEKKQLNFNNDYTTSFDNSWPSYRLHSLSINWELGWDIIPNSRMWIFNVIRNL